MNKPESKLAPAIGVLMILAVVLALFFPAAIQGRLIAPLDITTTLLAPWNDSTEGAKPHNHNPSDAVTQYLPYRIHAAQSLEEDGYIGWNPFAMGGYNLAANTMALPGTWTMQLHRFLSFRDAWNWGVIAEFLIAGIGMLVFLRGRRLPWMPCLIGAVAFMLNTQFVVWIYHRWALGSFCWMPWVLWSALPLFDRKELSARAMSLPIFLTLAICGGTLQHVVFVMLACGCIYLGSLSRKGSPRKAMGKALVWGLVVLVALAMSAFTWVPQVQAYLTNVSIGHTRGGVGYPEGGAQPLLNLLFIPAQVWPWLLGDPQSIDASRLLKAGFMEIAYFGTVPMILAICGMFFRDMPKQGKWLVAVGLLVPLTPLVGPLYHRVQLLTILGGAWIAAEMLAKSSRFPPRGLLRGVCWGVVGLGIALLIGTCLPDSLRSSIESRVVAASLEASKHSQFGSDQVWITQRAQEWTDRFSLIHPRMGWVYALLVLGAAGMLLVSSGGCRTVRWGYVVVFGATLLELATFFRTWTTFSDPKDLVPRHPMIERVRGLGDSQRVFQGFGHYPIGEIFVAPNLLAACSVPSLDAYESIQYRSTYRVLDALTPEDRLSLSGVSVSVLREEGVVGGSFPDWPIVETAHGFVVRKNPNPIALVNYGEGRIPEEVRELVPRLKDATSLQPLEKTMNRWVLDCPMEADWLRISQNWHEGWKWRSGDGKWQTMLCGPDFACWLRRPKSDSKIEVRFFPRQVWLRFISPLLGVLWVCLIGLVLWRNKLDWR